MFVGSVEGIDDVVLVAGLKNLTILEVLNQRSERAVVIDLSDRVIGPAVTLVTDFPVNGDTVVHI